jgi:hypothetical protein
MILTHYVYSTVKVTYDEPVEDFDFRHQKMNYKEEETWREAEIFFELKDDYATLRIGKGDKSILLGRAKVIRLTPWDAKFEAYWWAGYPIDYTKDRKPKKRQKSGFRKLVRADIVCEV